MRERVKRVFLMTLVAAALCVCTTACRSDATTGAQFEGLWKPVSAKINGQALSDDELAQIEDSFTLNENGQAIISFGENSEAGSWKINSKGVTLMTARGNKMKLTGIYDELTWENETTTIVFEKQ